MSEDLGAFVQKLPKAELHLHLEGAVPWGMVRAHSEDGLSGVPSWWDRDYRFPDFDDFRNAMGVIWHPFINTLRDIADAAQGVFCVLVAQNVRYVEISFGAGAYAFPPNQVAEAIVDVVPAGLTVKVFAGISRHRDLDNALWAGREAVGSNAIDGIDLHGDERVGQVSHFASIYAAARERGMMTKAHAGELGGPEVIWEVVRLLKVKRIEHGVAAVRDPDLVTFLRDEGVVLDVCPWSNVKLNVAPSLRMHPLKALYKAGVCVTLNTDDPTAFGHTLTDEYRWLVGEMGLSIADVGAIATNGFRVANLPEDERQAAIAEIEHLCGKVNNEI
ncbi:MAG: adenosine deaminase family protein [Candidatus Latescibacteria bacterium]|jgi:adenosine deaminase|nr:adenosine deaminase family protein [Candidatus Latescibacterota bacterium]